MLAALIPPQGSVGLSQRTFLAEFFDLLDGEIAVLGRDPRWLDQRCSTRESRIARLDAKSRNAVGCRPNQVLLEPDRLVPNARQQGDQISPYVVGRKY